MIWYLLNILIISIVWLLLNEKKVYQLNFGEKSAVLDKNAIYCIVASTLWILLSGLRGLSVGADTLSYKVDDFDVVKNYSWDQIFERFVDKYIEGEGSFNDPSFYLINKVFQIFSDNYQLFLLFIALVFFIPFGIFVCKNSKNPHFSFILFSCLFFEFYAITGLRQTIATAIVVFGGYALIKRKKWLAYILIVLLASTIHLSVLCVLPFYWLSKIKINKITLLCYWIATICSFVFNNQLLFFLKFLLNNDKYNGYIQTDGASAGTFLFLLIAVGIVVTLFHKNILKYSPENGRLLINALMIAVLFSSLLLINENFMRIVQYYSLYLVLLLPEMESIMEKPRDKKIYRIAAECVLILLLINKNPDYVFFWQEILG